jgi:hypothetical protein
MKGIVDITKMNNFVASIIARNSVGLEICLIIKLFPIGDFKN